MNEKLLLYKDKSVEFWKSRSTVQKGIMVGSVISIIALFVVLSLLSSKSNFVPLYTNLSVQETGQIKESLDARGIASEITDNGATISVPETQVDILKVELAAEGIPSSGSIDYTFIKDQMGFGMTDNEFSVMERAAMQTELANLIANIDGVNSANVMITLPEETVWISDETKSASASIVTNLAPGYQLDQKQVRALYHLASKSVPNLPIESIVIMNQMFEHYEYKSEDSAAQDSLTAYEQQRTIKQDIERDLQRQVQQMLGTMMGHNKVVVSVTTDVDFTQENRSEELVTPVDEENMEGLAISVERITETFTGDDVEGGVVGAGEGDIPGYPGVYGGGAGDYERIEERVNNDVNRIRRDIVESPYKVRDVGIQVMVEPPNPEDPASLPVERINDIEQILGTIVRTTISSDVAATLTPEDIDSKVFVSSQPFNGKIEIDGEVPPAIPTWLYIAGGILVAIILLLIVLLVRKNKRQKLQEVVPVTESEEGEQVLPDIPDGDQGEASIKRRQLEKMAKENPENFTKLIRTWLSED